MTRGGIVVEMTTTTSTEPLLPSKVSYARNVSRANDKLRSLRFCLRWMCINQSDARHVKVSWSLFLLLGIVSTTSHFFLSYAPTCRTHDVVVQLFLTSASGLTYLYLSAFVRRYVLRRFLFLDKLVGEREQVWEGYMDQLNHSFHLLSVFVMLYFVREVAYKVRWYSLGLEWVLFVVTSNAMVGDVVPCTLKLMSDIRKLLSSSSRWERLRAYDALLGNNGSVMLVVVTSTMTPPPAIDGGLSFFF
ncbi:unnamed protein product [Musa acuminata subsp. malaccensis]|uniref:(wild Malaysian banana) hypothetical protein n=1 Tax=Musa acuminata subsp. malaccensis TaxID=214687 RepID=A0A804K730_MUSAM|nr:unnamed protein product [Musa acuminata subsp. malaccensis]